MPTPPLQYCCPGHSSHLPIIGIDPYLTCCIISFKRPYAACSGIISNCALCSNDGTDTCSVCSTNYLLSADHKSCSTQCAAGEYKSSEQQCSQCAQAISNCAQCSSDGGLCSVCNANYLLSTDSKTMKHARRGSTAAQGRACPAILAVARAQTEPRASPLEPLTEACVWGHRVQRRRPVQRYHCIGLRLYVCLQWRVAIGYFRYCLVC